MHSSTLRIEEIGVLNGRQARVVVLSGAGLPHKGAEWGTEARITTTWYPGNASEASQQTLGPRELNSSWEGTWSRVTLPRSGVTYTDEKGATSTIIAPANLRDILDAMFREGHLLRVTWSVAPGSGDGDDQTAYSTIVREGRCKSWKFPHQTAQDIGWNFEFEWKGRGLRTQRPVSTSKDDKDITGQVAAVAAKSNKVTAAVTQQPEKARMRNVMKSASTFTLGQLEQFANLPLQLANSLSRTIRANVSQLKQLADILTRLNPMARNSQPQQIYESMKSLAVNTRAVANNFVADNTRRSPEVLTNRSGYIPTVRSAVYFGRINDSAISLSGTARTLEQTSRTAAVSAPLGSTLSSQTQSGTQRGFILAVHIPKEGDTPISVSMKYYGSPDFALDILKCNRLPWHQANFVTGRPLIIPALATKSGISGV